MAIENQPANDRADKLAGTRITGDEMISGVVHVIRDEAELDKFREGEILVAKMTDPSWSALFAIAKAVITENGGSDCEAVHAADEYDLPTVIGVEGATLQLRSGDIVQINIDGSIERLAERREPDSPMRVSVPAAVSARELAGRVSADPNVVAMPKRDHHNEVTDDKLHNKKIG